MNKYQRLKYLGSLFGIEFDEEMTEATYEDVTVDVKQSQASLGAGTYSGVGHAVLFVDESFAYSNVRFCLDVTDQFSVALEFEILFNNRSGELNME